MTRRSRLTGLLRHPDEPRVLLLRSDRTWRPPRALAQGQGWIAAAEAVAPAFERRLGTRPWLLRHLSFTHDEEQVLEVVEELELLDPSWQPPPHGRWAGRDELERLRLRDDERALVAAYLDSLENVPAARPAWSRPGWHKEARAWLEAELARLGRRLDAVEQVKVWGISTVLRLETDRGDLWFKASAPLPLFVDEAVVTQRLATRFPGHVPTPVAVEPERGWILFEPFDVVGWDLPLDVHRELFSRFAGLQLRTPASRPRCSPTAASTAGPSSSRASSRSCSPTAGSCIASRPPRSGRCAGSRRGCASSSTAWTGSGRRRRSSTATSIPATRRGSTARSPTSTGRTPASRTRSSTCTRSSGSATRRRARRCSTRTSSRGAPSPRRGRCARRSRSPGP